MPCVQSPCGTKPQSSPNAVCASFPRWADNACDPTAAEVLLPIYSSNFMVYYCYKCAAKVIVLIVFFKCFSYFYTCVQKKLGSPVGLPENLLVRLRIIIK